MNVLASQAGVATVAEAPPRAASLVSLHGVAKEYPKISTSGDRRLTFGMAALLLSLVGFQGALLSALIMFAPRGLYSAYSGNPPDDQALAGVLMCIPASFVYLGSTLWALARMLGNERTGAH